MTTLDQVCVDVADAIKSAGWTVYALLPEAAPSKWPFASVEVVTVEYGSTDGGATTIDLDVTVYASAADLKSAQKQVYQALSFGTVGSIPKALSKTGYVRILSADSFRYSSDLGAFQGTLHIQIVTI